MKKQHSILFLTALLAGVLSCQKEEDYRHIRFSKNADIPADMAVDLGLSVNWRSGNLGAASAEDDGNFYAWAETVYDKERYDWNSYEHWGAFGLLKYNLTQGGNVDNQVYIRPEDDPATKELGGKWRVPTAEEWRELISHCTCEVATLHGVVGYKLTSKLRNSHRGKYIFIPASGSIDGTERDYDSCLYWSSRLWDGNSSYAFGCLFKSDDTIFHHAEVSRNIGLPIRAVQDKL